MTSQLRMYTINRGMMDQWVNLFTETLVPMQEKYGIKIEGMWVSEDSTQFIWIRSFADSEDLKVKEAAFNGSPEWNAVMDHARSHIARTVVQTMEPFLNVTGDSLRRGDGKLCELRIYTISRGMVEPWAKFHTGTLVPVLRKHGIGVEGIVRHVDEVATGVQAHLAGGRDPATTFQGIRRGGCVSHTQVLAVVESLHGACTGYNFYI